MATFDNGDRSLTNVKMPEIFTTVAFVSSIHTEIRAIIPYYHYKSIFDLSIPRVCLEVHTLMPFLAFFLRDKGLLPGGLSYKTFPRGTEEAPVWGAFTL